MRKQFIILSLLVMSGCNLFRETTPGGATPDAGPTDASTASDASASDAATGDMSVTQDVGSDTGSDAGACVAETDAEICEQLGAECGAARTVSETVTVKLAGPEIATSSCTPLDGFGSLCNTSATADVAFNAPQDGDYLALLSAHDTSSSAVRAVVEIQLDGAVVTRLLNPYQAPDTGELSFVLEGVPAGDHVVSWRMVYDAYVPEVDFDLNLRVESGAVLGPVNAFVDRCGTQRVVDCGECAGNEACGTARVGQCGCPCPLPDGTCAGIGPHPSDACLECTDEGWQGTTTSCDDNDNCTLNDSCNARAGVCSGTERTCVGELCENGTCENGECVFTPKAEGDACGDTGICQSGVCGCPGGPIVETACNGNTDDDCDGLTNCEDPDCDGLSCGGQRMCTAGVCQ